MIKRYREWMLTRDFYSENMKYDPKITAKRFFIILAEVIIAGAIVYLTDNQLWLVLVPVLEALRNWFKHGIGVRLP
jgi:hypothetical protein